MKENMIKNKKLKIKKEIINDRKNKSPLYRH